MARRPAGYGIQLPQSTARTQLPTWTAKAGGQRRVIGAPVALIRNLVVTASVQYDCFQDTIASLSPPGGERWTVRGGIFALQRNGANSTNGSNPAGALGFNDVGALDALYQLSSATATTVLQFTQPLIVNSGTPLTLRWSTAGSQWGAAGPLVASMNLTVDVELETSPYEFGNP